MEDCGVCAADAEFIRLAHRPDYETMTPRIRVVDLFAGGGGLSLGIAEAASRIGRGTTIVAAVENDPQAAGVLKLNFPTATVIRDDVQELFDGVAGHAPTSRESKLVELVGKVDLLLAGPPCQGHSDLNNHTRRDDPRNSLYVRAARAAEVLRPQAVLIENVPAVEHDVGRAVPVATKVLADAGYRVAADVLDLMKLGVPQRRRRHILLATSDTGIDPRDVLATTIACSRHSARSVEWAIGDLRDVVAATGWDSPTVASAKNVERMQWLVDNDQYDLPNERRPVCHHDEHSYVSMYGRLRWNSPAQTITTGYGSMGQGRYVHPALPRTVTPHEAARLQTLPDFFELGAMNTRRVWAHVIGNAVPPLLGVHIGVPLLSELFPTKKRRSRGALETGSRKLVGAEQARRRAGVPEASSAFIRERMRTTKRRDTKPERLLRSELHRRGLRFVVDRAIDGTRRRADIVFRGPKIVVFVDGCYWHNCPTHGTIPKENRQWWEEKFRANRLRDADTDARLARDGWHVLRFWEHDDPVEAAEKVAALVHAETSRKAEDKRTPARAERS